MAHRYRDTGIPYLRSLNIEPFRINLSDLLFIGADFHRELAKSALAPGDVVVVRTGKPGTAAVVPSDLREANCSDLVIIRPGENLDPHFVACVLNSAEGRAGVYGSLVGSVQAHFNVGAARDFRFRLPPIDEQHRIADVLGALDDKVELNRRMNETLEQTAEAIFRRLASGTARARADDEFVITMGQSPPGETYNEIGAGTPFFQGRADFGFRYPTERVFCTVPTRLASVGDTLVSVRAPVGDVNMALVDCAVGRGVAAVRHRSGSRSFTYYAMQGLRREFEVFESEGTVFGSLSKKDFHRLQVPAPPPAEVTRFEELVGPLDERIEVNERESRTLAALRDALLPKLISGELRIRRAGAAVG